MCRRILHAHTVPRRFRPGLRGQRATNSGRLPRVSPTAMCVGLFAFRGFAPEATASTCEQVSEAQDTPTRPDLVGRTECTREDRRWERGMRKLTAVLSCGIRERNPGAESVNHEDSVSRSRRPRTRNASVCQGGGAQRGAGVRAEVADSAPHGAGQASEGLSHAASRDRRDPGRGRHMAVGGYCGYLAREYNRGR